MAAHLIVTASIMQETDINFLLYLLCFLLQDWDHLHFKELTFRKSKLDGSNKMSLCESTLFVRMILATLCLTDQSLP